MCRICAGLLTFSLAATDDLSVVMPDLQDMCKEIDGLDELEREILTQLSVTSASTGVTASHSAPQMHENLESKSSLRERLTLIRMKRSVSRSQHRQHLHLQHLLRGMGQNSTKASIAGFHDGMHLNISHSNAGLGCPTDMPQSCHHLKPCLAAMLRRFFAFRSALQDKVKDYRPDLDCCPLVSLSLSPPCLSHPSRPHDRHLGDSCVSRRSWERAVRQGYCLERT
jgi:hypothetical protein